jgi:Putative adipose-regulatory protein (Seipin)
LQLTLPETPENEALFQMHSFLKSDSDAVLHTLQRPLSLPHRSPIVRKMRQVALFPFFLVGTASTFQTAFPVLLLYRKPCLLHAPTAEGTSTAGILSESETISFPLAKGFTELSHSPLAAVEVLLTGARPQDPPPRVSHGLLTVNVRMRVLPPLTPCFLGCSM